MVFPYNQDLREVLRMLAGVISGNSRAPGILYPRDPSHPKMFSCTQIYDVKITHFHVKTGKGMGGSRGYKNIFTVKSPQPAPDFYNVKSRELFGSVLTRCTHVTPPPRQDPGHPTDVQVHPWRERGDSLMTICCVPGSAFPMVHSQRLLNPNKDCSNDKTRAGTRDYG
jgi:hypothetical protein